MDEAELAHDLRCQDKGVEVLLAHAVVEAIDRVGKWEPRCDQRNKVALAVGIEIVFR